MGSNRSLGSQHLAQLSLQLCISCLECKQSSLGILQDSSFLQCIDHQCLRLVWVLLNRVYSSNPLCKFQLR